MQSMLFDPQATGDLTAAQVRRVVALRWLSVGVMLISALVLPPILDLSVPIGPLLSVALAMAALNFFSLGVLQIRAELPSVVAFLQLLADVVGWSAFLYYSGGATNPLISLLLPLVAVGAMILSAPQAWLLAAGAVVAYSLLWNFNQPIRLHDAAVAAQWHLAGMWMTFALSACVIVGFLLRLTAAVRMRERALADAREARVRDERIVALGNLAAGAAHNLGTPLGTLRILVDELRQHDRLESEVRADLDLMSDQIEHCRQTLAMLTAKAGSLRAEGGGTQTVAAWLEREVAAWQEQRPRSHAVLSCAAVPADLAFVVDDTLGQALHTLINNAADASPDSVEVEAAVDGTSLVVEVRDRGPGIPESLRNSLGMAPLDDRPAGMGIGLFLARAALDRQGGTLSFAARRGGGTVARIELPLEQLST